MIVRASMLLNQIGEEYLRASKLFPKFNSTHEGYAVIKEELDELWSEVKADNPGRARGEALHVAAMALRFMIDIPGGEQKHNLTFDEPDRSGGK